MNPVRPARISAAVLLRAYRMGLFPMAAARRDPEIHWVDPETRGVLPLDRFHLPRSLARTARREAFALRVDGAFDAVVAACAAPAPGRRATWINRPIQRLYGELFRLGYAHSVECWRGGRLAGGLYGVALGGAFFGESMFSRARDASKLALAHLAARLAAGGFRLLDVQFHTAHLARFGAVEIPRAEYLRRLAAALEAKADFYSLPAPESAADWLPFVPSASGGPAQSSTITS